MTIAYFRFAALAAVLGLPACGAAGFGMSTIPRTQDTTANTVSRAAGAAKITLPTGLRALPGATAAQTPAPATPAPSPAH